jgi:aminoglycoside phosphotransferase family enzyme
MARNVKIETFAFSNADMREGLDEAEETMNLLLADKLYSDVLSVSLQTVRHGYDGGEWEYRHIVTVVYVPALPEAL